MDDTRDRLIALEQAVEHGNNFTAYRLEQIESRLAIQENKPDSITRVIGWAGWAKVILAVVLMLIAFIASGGDMGATLRAARSAG